MISIFKKAPRYTLEDFSTLAVDMHSHLLPGIDDGAPSMEHSLRLIGELYKLGYHKIITTPHIHSEYYPNTSEIIQQKLQEVRQALQVAQIPVDFHAAAEYYLDEHFESLLRRDEPLLCIHKNYVLVEISFFGSPPKLENYLFDLQMKGYKPILAHPERYAYFGGDLKAYKRFKDLGCLLQVNLLSLAGYYGKNCAETGQKLIKNGLVELLGSDLHHERHLQSLQSALENKSFAKLLLDYEFQNARLLA